MQNKTIFIPLSMETRTLIPTSDAACHLNYSTWTLRSWSCFDNGPIRPVRIHGKRGLWWNVEDIKRLLLLRDFRESDAEVVRRAANRKEKQREYRSRWKAKNPERFIEVKRQSVAKNKERKNEYDRNKRREQRAANSAAIALAQQKWRAANPGKDKLLQRGRRERLDDCYVRGKLKQYGIPNASLELIALKRTQLQVLRATKQLTETIKEKEKCLNSKK